MKMEMETDLRCTKLQLRVYNANGLKNSPFILTG